MIYVYIAGRVTAAERLRIMRDKVRQLGYSCHCAWMDNAINYPVPHRDAREYSVNDLKEIRKSEIFILDTIDENPTGGREVEYGYAMGRCGLILVGPERNIYHALAHHRFEDWDGALRYLQEISPEIHLV